MLKESIQTNLYRRNIQRDVNINSENPGWTMHSNLNGEDLFPIIN